jgi:xylulokinase
MGIKETFLLGVDIGSGSLKSTIIRGDGSVVSSASKDLNTSYPHPRWSEQNPEDWYDALCETVKRVFEKSGLKKIPLAAVCVTAAAHTPVLLDENDVIIRPAILWTDQRSVEEVSWLNERYGDRILAVGYNKANPTWTLPMLLWVRNKEPDIFAKIRKVMVAKDYLRFRLTGTWETDWIDALGTLFLDAGRRCWSQELCGYIGLPVETLPPIVAPTAVVGKVSAKAARDSSIPEGTPVVAGTSDTAAEDYGVGAVNPGQGIIKLATAGNANIMTETPHPHPLLLNYYHVVPGLWYTVAATNSCASAHRWLRDQFFSVEMAQSEAAGRDAFDVMDEFAADVELGAGGMLFHPYLLGERSPYWDPFLRADFIGLTMRHGREHFVRALYEGIAFSLVDCMEAMLQVGEELRMKEVRIIGGGARSGVWRQIVSDATGLEVLKTAVDDASYGSAIIGGVGTGVYVNERDAVDKCVQVVSSNKPDPRGHEKYQQLFAIYRKAQSRLAEINHELHAFSESL